MGFIGDAFVYINFAGDLLHYWIIELSFLIQPSICFAAASTHTGTNTIAQLEWYLPSQSVCSAVGDLCSNVL